MQPIAQNVVFPYHLVEYNVVSHYRSDDLRFILRRYFGRNFLKHGSSFLGIPHGTLTSYTRGRHPVPVSIWIRLQDYAPMAKERQRAWAKNRKERIDTWLVNREAYVDNTVLAMKSYAEEARRARASRKGNQLKTGE